MKTTLIGFGLAVLPAPARVSSKPTEALPQRRNAPLRCARPKGFEPLPFWRVRWSP